MVNFVIKLSKTYTSRHQVFGELEVSLDVEGSNDKNNKSSLTIKNVSVCYPFTIHTSEFTSIETDQATFELNGSGEEVSLIECLVDIVDKLKKDGWVSQKELKEKEG